MRTLFTIYNVEENKLAFENWMTHLGIPYRNRVVLTDKAWVNHFVVDTEDFNNDVDRVEHWVDPEARRWEVTACNKQYCREWVGDQRRYLGSMCQVDAVVAQHHLTERGYHWALLDKEAGKYWIAQFRNPNTVRHFTSDPASIGAETGRWPRDPRCPTSGLQEVNAT